MFWRDFFKQRPDLEPPGYEETIKALGYQDEEEPEEEIEF